MSVQADIRDAIVTCMLTVPDVGIVHTRAKFAVDSSTYLDNFSTLISGKKVIRGWWLTIPTILSPSNLDSAFDAQTDSLDYAIRGVHSYSDKEDTETDFENLIFSVRDSLRSQITMSQGPVKVIPYTISVTIPVVDLRQFGSVLCHYCEMHLTIEVNTSTAWVDGT